MGDFLNLLAAPVTMAAVFIVVVLVAIVTVKNLIVIVPPNRAAVITGRNRMLTDGQAVGYRSISGGRTLRIPIIETVQHVNLETIPIEVSGQQRLLEGKHPAQRGGDREREDRLRARVGVQQRGRAPAREDRG